jgi:16S rRNA (guanine966-N2)-methyltransferase
LNPRTPKSPPPAGGRHKLRIIGGRWRSRTLVFPAVDGLRPTGDRIRETLFNWLMPVLPGSRCLDLFAGSGILGFEALSRGADSCTLVELNPAAARQLEINAGLLGADTARIVHGNALVFLAQPPTMPFDLVFVDPPFAGNLWQEVLIRLEQGWLCDGAWVYLETPLATDLVPGPKWHLHRQKQAGQVCYSLYRYETNLHPPM